MTKKIYYITKFILTSIIIVITAFIITRKDKCRQLLSQH